MTKIYKPRLVLLDSHAILHRAYHAIPDFATSKGEPTGALYGLASMLLKITQELKPTYVVACRDMSGKTHRHEVYKEYKGTRMKADDALISQLKLAPEVFDAFGVPVYGIVGYEADDCIATIVEKLSKSDIDVVIATGDMDTLQLVTEKVSVYTLRKGLNDTVTYTPEKVKERYGFGPEHITDYKGLRGDPSDNIKGIVGIGEKTATDLVVNFGSIETMYSTLKKDESMFTAAGIKPRIISLLKENQHDAEFSKKLATVHRAVPLTFALPKKEWVMTEYTESIVALCDKYEFRSLKERLRSLIGEKKEIAAPQMEGLFGPAPVEQKIDASRLKETGLALWLLRSDITTPDLNDILRFANTDDFETARRAIFAELNATKSIANVFETIEQPLLAVVERMNAAGVTVDTNYLKTLSKEYSTQLAQLEKNIYTHAGREFNINSPKQLGVILYDELKLGGKIKKTATGARTTREEELQKLSDDHVIIGEILKYRELQKLLSTYIDAIPGMVASDGRLHATFLQTGTVTGRMGCENPNLQNIPIKTENGARIRSAFVAEKGKVLVALDYSQIELRIAAGLSGDNTLVSAFKNGADIHAAVAAKVFHVNEKNVSYDQRRRAKVINFGILYGMGVNALRQALGAEVTRDEAQQFFDEYFANFRMLASWIEKTKQEAERRGFTETIFGRRRYFPGFQSSLPSMKAQAERMAINAPIQGSQADIVKKAMVAIDLEIEKQNWRSDVQLLLQVHDELIYEITEEKAEKIGKKIKEIMESVAPTEKLSGVPIVAEMALGKNWGEV